MDEVIFRTSQKVDNIQYHLKAAADESKNAVAHFSEKVRGVTLKVLENPKYSHVVESTKKFIAIALKIYKECKEFIIIHYHPKILLRKVLKLLGRNFSKREILIGSAGVIAGVIIGFSISHALPGSQEVLRYMQAIQCMKYTGDDAVVLVEDALGPKGCGKNEALVNVKAASLNAIDIEISKGYGSLIRKIASKYFKHCQGELPITLGRDCTGVVVDIGENIGHLEIGDEVWLTAAFWAPGTMTEYIVVSENRVSHKPKTIGFEGAASLPYCGSIVLSVLKKINVTSKNANNKNIFVHGGCSATGCILLQILNAWGAKITTSCYKRAVPVAKALGVIDVIELSPLSSNAVDLSNGDFNMLRNELRHREKFDVVITTTICELNNQELLEFCKSNGKVISTLPQPLRSDLTSYFTRPLYSLHFKISGYIQKIFTGNLNNFGEDQMCRHMLDDLRELVENGKIQTVVDRVFQPYDIDHALNHIQSSESIGSTVISFR